MIKFSKAHLTLNILGLKIKISKNKINFYSNIGFISNYINKKYNYINNKYDKNIPEAVLVYDYKSFGNGYYNPTDINIGDYIQSLAAKQYLGEDLELIDRDSLNFYDKQNVNMIMNGWYYIYEGNNLISSKINPLFVALHLNNPNTINSDTLEYFKKHEPIGCRDYATRNFLLSNGVKAYFSGCLTTTLDLKYKKENVERSGVIFCDYSLEEKKKPRINKTLTKILKQYSQEKIEHVTHQFDFGLSHSECFNIAESLLNKYATAKLVITTRIHCALPCLALGTPVILVVKKYDKKRYNGLIQLLNVVGYSRHKLFINKVLYNKNNEVINSEKFKPIANDLKQKISNWKK